MHWRGEPYFHFQGDKEVDSLPLKSVATTFLARLALRLLPDSHL